MNGERVSWTLPSVVRGLFVLVTLFLLSAAAATAQTFSLNVTERDGTPVTEYRWLLQEDTTVNIIPGVTEALSHGFHTSHSPVISTGDQTSTVIGIPDPTKRYFVSVLPASGHTMSGAPVPSAGGTVEIRVDKHPIPTAQISVFVFEDNYPINNAPDLPEEHGLAGFKITLEDAGGRYGISAGSQMMDIFGNPIGTVYGEMGTVVKMGDGVVTSDANGEAVIRNLAPGKYSIIVVPPEGENWQQTSTIEGTKVIDAWVKANEPPFFVEFGPPGYHVFVGFVKPTLDASFFTGNNTVTGRIVNLHTGRPPEFSFNPGHPIPGAWVGLNSGPAGTGRGVYAAPADANSEFVIPNVPDGTYQLALWDENLDLVFGLKDILVQGGTVALGDIPVFNWFGRLENTVFEDLDGDGFRDDNETGMPDQVVNIRFRDGSLYQSMPTDTEGDAPFEEVFPFFNWLVAEVDYTRYRPTGATIVVDGGGPVPSDLGWDMPSHDVLNPQPQAETNVHTGNNYSRTETGAVLTQAFQLFLGQTNVIEWGKAPYQPGQNGGISGVVHYAATRSENDPKFAVAEPWEPGIPRVQVNLYLDADGNGVIDDVDGLPGILHPDVDNHPLGWADGTAPRGPEDIDREDPDHVLVSDAEADFDTGDTLQIVWTDSWDDSTPSGAQGDNGPGFEHLDTFDGLRNFNQVRPGVFDGGYAFNDLPMSTYIVEAIAPPGYEHQKEEDKNVDFGDEYVGPTIPVHGGHVMPGEPPSNPDPAQGYLDNMPVLVGELHLVPDELTLFPGVNPAFAGQMRPLPDRKQVRLSDGLNAACNFFLFTQVPVAGHIVGIILDDTANEFDPRSPAFGEKYSPPFLPISIRDWTGEVISWTLSDKYGAYNALVPSTYTANAPQPSGMSPNMLTVVLNDSTHPTVPHNPKYSQFMYTFQYMPGTTTYLDTPVIPIAAFAGPGQFPVDGEFENGTPVVSQVDNGPYVAATGQQITIRSMGTAVTVENPAYDGTNSPTVVRDFGFGTVPGTVSIGGRLLTNVSWSPTVITGTVASGTRTGQLSVVRGDNGRATLLSVTVTVGPLGNGPTGQPRTVRRVSAGESIQAAINAANPGDLILVGPGTFEELLFMNKPVQLQGWGAGVTIINAVQSPAEKVLNWRNTARELWTAGGFDLLPSQDFTFTALEPVLASIEGAGIAVFGKNATPENGGFGFAARARIDGFTIEGASTGGGIYVNGYARFLEISNNTIRLNSGFNGGGITVGKPDLIIVSDAGEVYDDSENDHLRIRNNRIAGNGGLGGAGGGIALYTGADYYEITDNLIVGNFMTDNGGGIGHFGRSENGVIARNRILFNQSFNQGLTVSGGGIFISGGVPLNAQLLSEGSGPVTIEGNLIQGNMAGAGDGGGIRVQFALPGDVVSIRSNMIVNNVSGLAGGGIALQDAADVRIIHNTVAHNDSTATAGEAFQSSTESAHQPAGIASRAHSPAFAALTGATFSNPTIDSNIIWRNRSFRFYMNPADPTDFGLLPAFNPASPQSFASYRDLGVIAPSGTLTSVRGRLTGGTAPVFAAPYFNGPRDPTILQPESIVLQVMPAFDEGGNFIDVRYGPLTAAGSNYHLAAALTGGAPGTIDFDGDSNASNAHIGADQYTAASTNRAPVAANDAFVFQPPLGYRAATFTVAAPGLLANDFDPNGTALTLITAPVTTTANGTLAISANGSFTYTLPERSSFAGVDTFSYRVTDGTRSSIAVVTIDVVRIIGNNPPVPSAPDIVTIINTTGTTRVLPNDPDLGNTHTYEIAGLPSHGSATVSTAGMVTYVPVMNYSGTDVLTVRVRDQYGAAGFANVNVDVSLHLPPSQDMRVQMPPDTDGVDTDGDGNPSNDNVYLLLGAGDGFARMGDGYEQYMFGFSDLTSMLPEVTPESPAVRTVPLDMLMHAGMLAGEWPAPTIKVKEGQKLYLNLVNLGMHMRPDLFDPHSIHWHGFPQAASVFDGVPDASISVNMQAIFTYYYNVNWPGTYLYHCHVEATEHMQMGMLGNLFVLPKQDNDVLLYPRPIGGYYKGFAYNDGDGSTGYDVDYPIQIGGFDPAFHDASLNVQPLPFATMMDKYPVINGRGYPDTTVAGNIAPTSVNTFVQSASVMTGLNTVRFYATGSTLSRTSGAYNGMTLMFTSGNVDGQSRKITDYSVTGSGTRVTIQVTLDQALPAVPARNSTFTIGKPTQKVSSRVEAVRGQRILLRISSVDVTRFYTLASTIPMEVVGMNARLLRGPDPDGDGGETGKNLYFTTNSVTLGGGESLDAIIDTGAAAPGTYLLYTTNLNYLSNNTEDFGGMMTEIVIRP